MKKLRIYYTSDIHGYLYPTDYTSNETLNMGLFAIANQIDKDENTLLIDGGDMIQGSPFLTYCHEQNNMPLTHVMNLMSYDYITLGNHDFNYGYEGLSHYLTPLNAKVLCSNVIDKTDELNIFDVDIKVMPNGLKVGIIGLSNDLISEWERPSHLEKFELLDSYKQVKLNFDKIKDCDVKIAIYHGGIDKEDHSKENRAYEFCKDFELDLLLTAHQHLSICNTVIEGTHLVQPPSNGRGYVDIDIEVDDQITIKSKLITTISDEETLLKFEDKYKCDLKVLNTIEEDVQVWLDQEIGELDIDVVSKPHLDMAVNGSYIANFLNQIQLYESGADISITSLANTVSGLKKHVTLRDVVSTYRYPDTLYVISISGKILKQAVEHSASYFSYKGRIMLSDMFLLPKEEHYNYDYYSGIEYELDVDRPVGNRVIKLTFKGTQVNDEDTFSLALNSHRLSGSGGYDFYKTCDVLNSYQVETTEMICNYLKIFNPATVDQKHYYSIKQTL